MSESNILEPMVAQIGIGGLGGLCVGYAVKRLAKIVAIITGLFFLGLQYLAYIGEINIKYVGLENWANGLVSGTGALEGVLTAMIANLPFASSFTVGLAMGLQMSTEKGHVSQRLKRKSEQEKLRKSKQEKRRKRQLKRQACSDEEEQA